MKQIIDGLTYNTDTARELCELPCSAYNGDFAHHNTSLYMTKKGAFFLSGHGVETVNKLEARAFLESADEIDTLEELFDIAEA
jgi:hypothetical protein